MTARGVRVVRLHVDDDLPWLHAQSENFARHDRLPAPAGGGAAAAAARGRTARSPPG
eukprot:COSAG02_NODE_42083_length_388_cov_0.705882_1_plen_56_part_10